MIVNQEDLFLETIYVINQNNTLYCKVCRNQCKIQNNVNETIQKHMVNQVHIFELQKVFQEHQECVQNQTDQNQLFALHIAIENSKISQEKLATYFRECLNKVKYLRQYVPEKREEHIRVLIQFYSYMLLKGKNTMDLSEIFHFLKENKKNISILKQLMKYYNVSFSKREYNRLYVEFKAIAKQCFQHLNIEEREQYFQQMLQDLIENNRRDLAIVFMLMRLPNFQAKYLSLIKLKHLIDCTQIAILPKSLGIQVTNEIVQSVKQLIISKNLDENDCLLPNVSQKELNRSIYRQRKKILKQTTDLNYKLFLENASLSQVKHLHQNEKEIDTILSQNSYNQLKDSSNELELKSDISIELEIEEIKKQKKIKSDMNQEEKIGQQNLKSNKQYYEDSNQISDQISLISL